MNKRNWIVRQVRNLKAWHIRGQREYIRGWQAFGM